MKKTRLLYFFLLMAVCLPVQAQPEVPSEGYQDGMAEEGEEMVRIEGGTFMPFFHTSDDSVMVDPFYMDKYAVTNAEFLEFVKAKPQWQRSQVKAIFADTTYLRHWAGDQDLGPDAEDLKNSPVTNISWFAARAYAQWKGKRLPTLQEWEFAASAGPDKPFAARDSVFAQRILNWYSETSPEVHPPVGQGQPNYHGVYDMHGLIWEWVQDYNIIFMNEDNPTNPDEASQFYCTGEGARATSDNYAAFLRYAFRSSLEGDYAIKDLGFRLAEDVN